MIWSNFASSWNSCQGESPRVRFRVAELFVILDAGLQLAQPQGEFGAVALVGGIGILAVELAAIEPGAQPFQRLAPPRRQLAVIDLALDRRQGVRPRRSRFRRQIHQHPDLHVLRHLGPAACPHLPSTT